MSFDEKAHEAELNRLIDKIMYEFDRGCYSQARAFLVEFKAELRRRPAEYIKSLELEKGLI